MTNLSNDFFKIKFNSRGLTSIENPSDYHKMDYLLQDENSYFDYKKIFRELGFFKINYNINGSDHVFDTNSKPIKNKFGFKENCVYSKDENLKMEQKFSLNDKIFEWKLKISNTSKETIEINDFELPLLFNTAYARSWKETYLRRAVRHSFIAGNGSFILLTKAGGDPPFLLMSPKLGTSIVCFDINNTNDAGRFEGGYSVFLHAAKKNKDKIWRLPTPSKILDSKESLNYGFDFKWVETYDQVRDALYESDLYDIRVMPGMSIPTNLDCRISIRSKTKSLDIISEYPEDTEVAKIIKKDSHYLFVIRFKKLGENILTLENEKGQQTYLQFFITEPLENLIKKRASFISKNQFHKNKEKWYNGLLGVWDMKTVSSPNPENNHDLQDYMVSGGDDCFKSPYLAQKNLIYPDKVQIQIIEYYLKNYVWGKHQRTEKEQPYPYGIHGGENWYVNRNNKIGFHSGGLGKDRMWRSFDYPHLILTYCRMYQIAKRYPEKCNYLTADEYLERAFGTAKAYFTVPISIEMKKPWDFNGYPTWAYTQGNFNEKIIPELINYLFSEGRENQAGWLKLEWEKKVKYFIYDHDFPFGSEMFFDATAFESTHAIAKYALTNSLEPDKNLWKNPNTKEWYSHENINNNDLVKFMDRQIQGNMACRGWLEMHFNQFGSDIRAGGNSSYNLSYMSQLGGWAILDYGLHFSKNMSDHINLGYASLLSSWALLNSGTKDTNYGYWYPGIENDGAAGWAYEPKINNKPWGVPPINRGIWNVDGEIDMGLGSSIDALCTILIQDPNFGVVCYGGNLEIENDYYKIFTMDGVGRKLSIRLKDISIDINLDRDQFSNKEPICIKKDIGSLRFFINNTTLDDHFTNINISSLNNNFFELFVNEELKGNSNPNGIIDIKLSIKKDIATIIELKSK